MEIHYRIILNLFNFNKSGFWIKTEKSLVEFKRGI